MKKISEGLKMAVSTAQKLAKAKYQHEKRTLIATDVSKEKGEFYRATAMELGISLSKLVQIGVEEFIQNHAGENFSVTTQSQEQRLSAADKKLIEEFNRLPAETQKALIKLIQSINQNAKQDSFPE